MTDTLEATDLNLEELLDNDERRHFRTACYGCASRIPAGSIIQSNCGELFRTRGGKVSPVDSSRCVPCKRNAGMRPCPVCGDFDVPSFPQ